jgi:hypothetical protein
MKKNKSTLLIMFLLLVAILFSIQLISQRQETRRDAYFSTSKLSLSLDETDLEKNDDFLFVINAEAQTKVHGFQTMICYDKNIELREGKVEDQIVPDTSAGFVGKSILTIKKEINGKNCVKFAFNSEYNDDSKGKWTDNPRIVSLKFRAVNSGEGKISIVEDETMMVGPDSSVVADHMIKIDYTNKELSYKIEEPKVLGDGLRFYYAFDGVIKDNSKCAMNWPVEIIVMDKNGKRVTVKDYVGKYVASKKVGTLDLEYFVAEVELSEEMEKENLALFIKGPKHLQIKYGADGQKSYYNEMYGKLSAFNLNDEKTKVLDFANYPILAGDIASDKSDGFVNALDFAYVKKKAIELVQITDLKQHKNADLDGNCKINSGDLSLTLKTLKEKQDQNY